MNIFVDTVTESLKKTFWTLTTNMGLIDEAKPLINMKSEFNYQRILLTRNKKSLKKSHNFNNNLLYKIVDWRLKWIKLKKEIEVINI